MRIYLDTNIILDFIFIRESTRYTRDFISKNFNNSILVTNNLGLNNIFYVGVEKFKEYTKTKDFLQYIENSLQWDIYDLTKEDRLFAYNFMNKNQGADFEDLQQYIAAKNSGCTAIITNDKNFPKLDIPLIRTNPNLKNYTPKNR